MRGTVMALAGAAALGALIATQVPSAGPSLSTEGYRPGGGWPYASGAQENLVTDPLPSPPTGEPAASADPFAAERGRALRTAYDSVAGAVPPECNLTSAVLAAVGQVESGSAGGRAIGADHRVNPPIYGPMLDGGARAAVHDTDGGSFDGSTAWDRSMGLMQMLPDTWRTLGVDGDDDGLADPQNVYDAALAVGSHLCAGGRNLASEPALRDAVYAYRGSAGYVDAVLAWTRYFTTHGLDSLGDLGSARPPEVRTAELDSPIVVAALPGRPRVAPDPSSSRGLLGLLANGLSSGRSFTDVVAAGPRSTTRPTPRAGTPTTPGSPTVGTTSPITTTPPAGTTAPWPTTTPPVTTTEPPVTTTEPPVTTTEPPVTTTEPPVTTTEPPVTTTEPPVTTTEPPVTTTAPPVTTTDTTTTDPTTTDSTTTAP
jgi:hypothetical protein